MKWISHWTNEIYALRQQINFVPSAEFYCHSRSIERSFWCNLFTPHSWNTQQAPPEETMNLDVERASLIFDILRSTRRKSFASPKTVAHFVLWLCFFTNVRLGLIFFSILSFIYNAIIKNIFSSLVLIGSENLLFKIICVATRGHNELVQHKN